MAARGGLEKVPAEARQELNVSRQTLAFVEVGQGHPQPQLRALAAGPAEGQLQEALRLMGEPVPVVAARGAGDAADGRGWAGRRCSGWRVW